MLNYFSVKIINIALKSIVFISDLNSIYPFFPKDMDLNAYVLNGRGLLHFAADYGQTEVIEYLLSKGADVNVGIFIETKLLVCKLWNFLLHLECFKIVMICLLVAKIRERVHK